MIWVLLQSESPWQHNDAITFFYLPLCFSVLGIFLRNRLREYVPADVVNAQTWEVSRVKNPVEPP